MKLFLVRHAQVQAPQGLCYGRSDIPADAQATRTAAQRIAAQLPANLVLVSSPLQRCRQMAACIAALRPDLPALRTDARIAEMDFGSWEGRTWDVIGQPAMDAWLADFADTAPGNGETVRAFMARITQAWQQWITSGQNTVWITHAGVIRAVELIRQGLPCPPHADAWPAHAVAYGACVEISR